MKKNIARNSSLKSWLIALIVFVVVAVIAVGVSFIPNAKNCKEVASAAVTELVDGNIYMFDSTVSTTVSRGSNFTTSTNIAGIVFSQNHSHVFDNLTFNNYFPSSQNYFQYRLSFYYQNSLVFYLVYNSVYSSSPYTYNIVSAEWSDGYGSESLTDNYFGFQYYYNGTLASGAWWNKFKDIITLLPSGPTLGSPIDFAFIVNSALYNGVPSSFVYLHCYEITNASSYAVNNSYVDLVVITRYSNSSLNTTNTYTVPNINGKYYLCLVLPPDIVSTEFVESVLIGFTSAQSSDDFLSLSSTVIADFQENGELLASYTDIIRNQGFNNGYQVGYSQGTANRNNLVDVIWATIQMPVRILFGDIDTDAESPTYNQYVGGLFNFTILGLDIRAFVLSIMSVCIIIAIMKIVVKFVV